MGGGGAALAVSGRRPGRSSSGLRTADPIAVSDAAVRLTGHPSVSQIPIHGWRAVLFALPFVACGIGIVLFWAVAGESSQAPGELVVLGGVMFGLFGVGLGFHGVRGVAHDRRVRASQVLRLHEPWVWDYHWGPRGIAAIGARTHKRWAAFSAAAVLVLAPFHVSSFDSERSALLMPLWLAVCDLGLLIALSYTARLAYQRAKFGAPRISFGHFPFRAGEVVEIYLEGVRGLERLERIDCALRFVEERYENTGSNGAYEVNCYQLYADGRSIEARMSGPMHLHFSLPAAEYSTRLSARPPRYWELALRGSARGVDLSARFLLPIYEKA
jgi:hypothetical protein